MKTVIKTGQLLTNLTMNKPGLETNSAKHISKEQMKIGNYLRIDLYRYVIDAGEEG
jgi:hypothetical protein